jgi:hypothetical protein
MLLPLTKDRRVSVPIYAEFRTRRIASPARSPYDDGVPEIAIDIALALPPALRCRALESSALLTSRMSSLAHPSAFQLGRPFPAHEDTRACEPHVSLFMLQIDESEIGQVLRAVEGVATASQATTATGERWAHNPCGAPELYFHRSAQWMTLQRAVVTAAEPLRRGRLRETDPAGVRLLDLIEALRRDGSDPMRLRQLLTWGYDEVADADHDRFRPHLTVAWPADNTFRVGLNELPAPVLFDGVLTDLAVFQLRPNGTCTRRYGGYQLCGKPPAN